jgi:hypothetical protein
MKVFILLCIILFICVTLFTTTIETFMEPIPEGEEPDDGISDEQLKDIATKAATEARNEGHSDKSIKAMSDKAVSEAIANSEKGDYELAASAAAEAAKKAAEAVEYVRKIGKELAAQDATTKCSPNAEETLPSLDQLLAEEEAKEEKIMAKGPILTTTINDLLPKVSTSAL